MERYILHYLGPVLGMIPRDDTPKFGWEWVRAELERIDHYSGKAWKPTGFLDKNPLQPLVIEGPDWGGSLTPKLDATISRLVDARLPDLPPTNDPVLERLRKWEPER